MILKSCHPQRWGRILQLPLATSHLTAPGHLCLVSLKLIQYLRQCGSRQLILLLALIEKRIFSLFIILVQGSFMFLCFLLVSFYKISFHRERHREEVCLGFGSSPYKLGTCKWLYCLLAQYLCWCTSTRTWEGMVLIEWGGAMLCVY